MGRGIAEIPPDIAQWIESAEFPVFGDNIVIREVTPGSAADSAGVKDGDKIMAINGEQVDPYKISEYINAHTSDQMPTHVLRMADQDGAVRDVRLTPVWNESLGRWMIGIQFTSSERTASFDLKEGETRRQGFTLSRGIDKPVRGYLEVTKEEGAPEEVYLQRYALLYTDEQGRAMQVDLLVRWSDGNTSCVVSPDLNVSGRYDGTTVRIKSPMVSLAPHTLAHEFRHVAQRDTEQLQMNRYYKPPSREGYEDGSFWREKHKQMYSNATAWFEQCLMVSSLARSRREARELLTPFLPVLNRLEDAKRRKKHQPTRLTFSVASAKEQTQEIDREIEAYVHELFDTGITTKDGLSALDIVRLPTLVIERDAEYGALVALRALKKDTGIDLLAPAPSVKVVMVQSGEGSSNLEEVEVPPFHLSINEIRHYMRDIGVNIPCFRTSRASMHKATQGGIAPESLEM